MLTSTHTQTHAERHAVRVDILVARTPSTGEAPSLGCTLAGSWERGEAGRLTAAAFLT